MKPGRWPTPTTWYGWPPAPSWPSRGTICLLDPQDACDAILAGYSETLDQGGCPLVLARRHHWLRDLAGSNLRDPVAFWDKLDKLPAVTGTIAREVTAALERWLPEKGLTYKLVHRIAGLGSLGRQRFVALADWRGGLIAREAKALRISACLWEKPPAGAGEILYQKILGTSVRGSTPGCNSAVRGSSAAWPPIAAASSSRRCRRTATSRSSCRRWARRRPTSTWATAGPRPRSGPTSPSEIPTGWERPPRRWPKRPMRTGSSGTRGRGGEVQLCRVGRAQRAPPETAGS